jgi:nucleoside-diphosphate-sugar epimerase
MVGKRKRVLMTGGAGYVASQLLPAFREKYEMVLIDVRDEDRQGQRVEGVAVADLTDPDRGRYASHFDGVDAVVHLGNKRRSGDRIDHYFDEKVNVEMAYNVFRSAYDAGVSRVAFASSNHAADWYEYNLITQGKMDMLEPDKLPLSDNFYGWAKATYEHIGFLFACGAFGRQMGVVMVRIGHPREVNLDRFDGNLASYKRHLGAYISPRDISQLFTRAIEAPNIENEHGVPWQVVYGISNNTRAFWSLANARRVLGYQPEDDSEVKFAAEIYGSLVGKGATGGIGRVGLT